MKERVYRDPKDPQKKPGKKKEKPEKEQQQNEPEEKDNGGIPDVDFRKLLGCG